MKSSISIPRGSIWISQYGHENQKNQKESVALFYISGAGIIMTCINDHQLAKISKGLNTKIKGQIIQFKKGKTPVDMHEVLCDLDKDFRAEILNDGIFFPFTEKEEKDGFWTTEEKGVRICPQLMMEHVWIIMNTVGNFQEDLWEEALHKFFFEKYPEFRQNHHVSYAPGVHVMEINHDKFALAKTIRSERFLDFLAKEVLSRAYSGA